MKLGSRTLRVEVHWNDLARGFAIWVPWRRIWNPAAYVFWTKYPPAKQWTRWPRDDWKLRYNDGFCIGCGKDVPDGGACNCDDKPETMTSVSADRHHW